MKHLGLSARQAMARAEALLGEVGMPEPSAACRPIRTSSRAASSSA
jgi:hypothetical protein